MRYQPLIPACVGVIVAFWLSSFAWGKSYPNTFNTECRLNKADAYDLGWQFPPQAKSPYRGQCLDTSEKRPAYLLQLNSGGIRFANFHYRGKFYEISMPRLAVAKVIFHTEHFKKLGPVQAAHTEMRFVLKQDAVLTYQYGPKKGQIYKKIRDIVLSVDYMAPKGVPYEAVVGFRVPGVRENYMNAYRFISTEDRYRTRIVEAGRTIRQYLLKLTPEEMDKALMYAAYFSHQKQTQEVYSLTALNCTTELFKVLGQAIGKPRLNWHVELARFTDPIAGYSVELLKKADLIQREIETLNQEFSARR